MRPRKTDNPNYVNPARKSNPENLGAYSEDRFQSTHVIILGSVFPYADKMPYVPSGRSILGGIEYNAVADRVKCHVCGKWVKSIARHTRLADGLDPRDYRRDYGLRASTTLASPASAARQATRVSRTTGVPAIVSMRQKTPKPKGRPSAVHHTGDRAEDRNAKSLCRAQIPARVISLAIKLGHTPTQSELRRETGNGGRITANCIRRTFNMSLAQFMKSIGLTPNLVGQTSGNGNPKFQPLPASFVRQHIECPA